MWTYRVKYAKLGLIRFISHLDTMRAIKRALSRAGVPIAFSKGFNPRPKISMGPPLSVGYESRCELADIVLSRSLSPRALHERLGASMPQGLDLIETERVASPSQPLSRASSLCYMVELPEENIFDDAPSRLRGFTDKESVRVERVRGNENKLVDVKQFVTDMELVTEADSRWLRVEISLSGRGTCSPTEVAEAVFEIPPERAKCLRIVRTNIRFEGRSGQVDKDA